MRISGAQAWTSRTGLSSGARGPPAVRSENSARRGPSQYQHQPGKTPWRQGARPSTLWLAAVPGSVASSVFVPLVSGSR